MSDVGIQRIAITDVPQGRGAYRFRDAQALWPTANILYRQVFSALQMPLLPGAQEVRCTKEEFAAGYDCELGIDVLLTFGTGLSASLQEKFLFTPFHTVTVEYYQDWRTEEPGDWFNMKCQYYFVGYDYPQTGRRFTDWILLDWPRIIVATTQERIEWETKPNTNDGARANFRYVLFDDIPQDCIIARRGSSKNPKAYQVLYL